MVYSYAISRKKSRDNKLIIYLDLIFFGVRIINLSIYISSFDSKLYLPMNVKMYIMNGDIYLREGNYEQSINQYNIAIKFVKYIFFKIELITFITHYILSLYIILQVNSYKYILIINIRSMCLILLL